MPTAEEILRSRAQQTTDLNAEKRKEAEAKRVAEKAVAKERFDAAVEAAVVHIESTGFEGGELRRRWQGGIQSSEIAVWVLQSDTPMPGLNYYYLAPSERAVVVEIGFRGDEGRRHHARNVTLKRTEPGRHRAMSEGWLMGFGSYDSAEIMVALTAALERFVLDTSSTEQ